MKVTTILFIHLQCSSSCPLPFLRYCTSSTTRKRHLDQTDQGKIQIASHLQGICIGLLMWEKLLNILPQGPMHTVKSAIFSIFQHVLSHLVVDLTTYPHAHTNSNFPLSFCPILFHFDFLFLIFLFLSPPFPSHWDPGASVRGYSIRKGLFTSKNELFGFKQEWSIIRPPFRRSLWELDRLDKG